MTTIDLNSDVGEREDLAVDVQEALLDSITSANIACGGHAGDEALMRLTLRQARARGVAIGAHPGYPDRENFGRVAMDMPVAALEASIASQVHDLVRLAGEAGMEVRFVKPHGALYNQAAQDEELARTIARAVARVSRELTLVGLAGSPALVVWKRAGFRTLAEAFADRRYEPDGSLRSRRFPDAVLRSPGEAAEQALRIAVQHEVLARDGAALPIAAQTLCIHSDSPGAVELAREVRQRLEESGVFVASQVRRE